MDRLTQLKFNPFDFDYNITKSKHFENYTAANLNCLACNYYLPNDFAVLNTDSASKKLSILSLNIRSIANKFDSFSNLLNTLKRPFSVISLTETWLNDINSENFNLPNFDFVCSNRANKKGGGVGFFISNNLNYKIRSDLNTNKDGIIETLFTEINSTSSKNIILGSIYRPPNGDFEMFENILNTILTKVDKTKKVTYLTGDFNIDLLKSDHSEHSNRFYEQLFTSSFFPLINRPTRITHHTATLIDNIFTNDLEQIESSVNGLIFSDISDHLPIFQIISRYFMLLLYLLTKTVTKQKIHFTKECLTKIVLTRFYYR